MKLTRLATIKPMITNELLISLLAAAEQHLSYQKWVSARSPITIDPGFEWAVKEKHKLLVEVRHRMGLTKKGRELLAELRNDIDNDVAWNWTNMKLAGFKSAKAGLRQGSFDQTSIDYLIQRLREPGQPRPTLDVVFSDFLECEPVDIESHTKDWSDFWFPMMCEAFAQASAAHTSFDWVKRHQWGPAFSTSLKPTYKEVKVGLDREATLMVSGTLFLETKGGTRLVCTLIPPGFEPPSIKVLVKSGNALAAKQLLGWVGAHMDSHNIYKDKVLAFADNQLQFQRVARMRWEDVVLPSNLTNELRTATLDMLRNRATFYDVGLGVRRSILLEGDPGVGKTQCCRALSNELYEDPSTVATVIWVSAKSIQSTRSIKLLYTAARELAPTALFMEDVDLIGGHRRSGGDDYLLGELLTQMDGAEDNRGLITIATTNDAQQISRALTKRPGRFDRVFTVPLPDASARGVMLARFLKQRKAALELDKSDMDRVISGMEGMTGAFIQEVVNTAVIEAVTRGEVEGGKPLIGLARLARSLKTVRDTFGSSTFETTETPGVGTMLKKRVIG